MSMESDAGRTSGQLLDILISRQDWDGARRILERLLTQSPDTAGPRLVEVLLAQARAGAGSEDAQLELYQRVRGMDAGNAEARAAIDRISKARAERARRDLPEITLAGGGPGPRAASPAGKAAPAEPRPAPAPAPEIEVRDPAAEAAIRRAREEEQKARAAAEAQAAALASERERLLSEARAASVERVRLEALLQATVAERERLSADLDLVRASQAGPPPSRFRLPRSRAARRAIRVACGLALAGVGALGTVLATRPVRIEVEPTSLALFDRAEPARMSATRILRIGTRRAAAHVAWSSADPRVATVDAQGVLTPTGTGRTRVEARDGDLVAGVDVSVSLPARIVVEPAELTVTPDQPEVAVHAAVLDGAGAPWKQGAEVAWASSAPGVAAFGGGKVRFAGKGEAEITASLGELHGRLVVHALDRRTALEQGCNAGGLDACVELGHLIAGEGGGAARAERALGLYEKACKAGGLRGCVAVGEVAESGGGGAPDVRGALAAYGKACEGAYAPGCTRLGRLYDATVHDFGKALASYRTACDAKDLEGCWRLGTLYELGRGVVRDAAAAAELHERACDGGVAGACTSLANMRWNGSGSVGKDVEEAVALFEKACDARSAEACIFLALKYKAGDGVAQSPPKAAAFFGKACAAGHKGSCVIAPRPPEP